MPLLSYLHCLFAPLQFQLEVLLCLVARVLLRLQTLAQRVLVTAEGHGELRECTLCTQREGRMDGGIYTFIYTFRDREREREREGGETDGHRGREREGGREGGETPGV